MIGDVADSERAWARGVTALCAGFVALGFAARVAPLFDQGGRLLQMFPTEHAYLMLTISRNLALGNGMSISDGTIPSNGVQPLATLLWAGCFWLVEGVKRTGVALVLAFEILLSAAAALGLERLARIAFAGSRRPALAASLAASVWWASPVTIPHSMNCLETQVYVASVVLAALLFLAPGTEKAWPLRRQLGFGAALGLCFLARSDAVFLILGACLVHLFRPVEGRRRALSRRLAETLVFVAVSVAVAAPWLVFNYLGFGSIVPLSGRSEAMGALAQSPGRVPAALVELALLVLPIPRRFQDLGPVVAVAALACAAGAVAAVLAFRSADARRRALIALAAFLTLSLSAFYGLCSSAGESMERYLHPASPFLALPWAWGALALGERLSANRLTWLAHAGAAGVLALAVAGSVDAYRGGNAHVHFQVVRWVDANVPEDVWVGAGQTGTLGFFHDRTLSFDGTVSPEALEARKRGELASYIVKKRVPYIADWVGAIDFMREPAIRARYEVLVNDPERNLAVLRLRRAPRAEPESGQTDTPE